ncbi:hypothetical protein BDW22DRAFT_1107595 [Trametopsis cervina]|nr:hypothetical protein BDW22DRAFT_1107595 [Trametopsis cervina]
MVVLLIHLGGNHDRTTGLCRVVMEGKLRVVRHIHTREYRILLQRTNKNNCAQRRRVTSLISTRTTRTFQDRICTTRSLLYFRQKGNMRQQGRQHTMPTSLVRPIVLVPKQCVRAGSAGARVCGDALSALGRCAGRPAGHCVRPLLFSLNASLATWAWTIVFGWRPTV